MPEGIVATVDDGFATLDFVDTSLRGPALTKLIEIGGAATIETITRVGPRRQYRVPEGNAREAGLLDAAAGSAPRGLASIEDQPEGILEDGVRGAFTPGSAGSDTGAAAALVAANPNTNVTPANAGNWHTPVAEYTSANKYVGTTTAAAERALAPSPKQYPGDSGGGYGGRNAAETPTHREVIDYVKASSAVPAGGAARSATGAEPEPRTPVQHLNASLGDQTSALGDDPGSRPDEGGEARGEFTSVQSTRQQIESQASVGTAEPAPDTEREANYPQGAPNDKWRRDELDAYASEVKGLNTGSLDSKKAVLAAINRAS